MSPEDVAVAQRIINRHHERFGPPPATDHASMVRWLTQRSSRNTWKSGDIELAR